MRPLATDITRSVVCLSVCRSHVCALQKWLNRSSCHLGLTHMGPENHVLDGVQIPNGKGRLLGVIWPTEKHFESLLHTSHQKNQ